jgi:hypothetical protein
VVFGQQVFVKLNFRLRGWRRRLFGSVDRVNEDGILDGVFVCDAENRWRGV